jgi:hypothetical protein
MQCAWSTPRRGRRPLARVGAVTVAALLFLPGCFSSGTARLQHPGVSNPIFLGDRMHVGDGERRFTLEEKTESYRGKSINMYMWSSLPILGESTDRDRIEADARPARKRLGISSYRAVNIRVFEVSSSSLLIPPFLMAIGSSVEFRGDMVEVAPAPDSSDLEEPGP